MICVRCGSDVPDGTFCIDCGWKQDRPLAQKRKRGNGTGSVYKLPNGKYKAVVVTGYYTTDDGKLRKKTRSATYTLKKEALAALPSLFTNPEKEKRKLYTFREVFELWLPTHKAGKSTLDNYKYAFRYFEPLMHEQFSKVEVDDLQECITNCPKGRRTKENMRAAVGLMYRYAIPRHLCQNTINLAKHLSVDGESAQRRDSLNDSELKLLWSNVDVPGVKDILIMCYTGFRPSEYLALTSDSYDPVKHILVGGAKTEAGKGRIVTVSPKVLPFVEASALKGGPICQTEDGSPYNLRWWGEKVFLPALEACGIDNPIVEVGGGVKRHRLTPHSCRHTFATMLKRVAGSDKDKMELIGHNSSEMLRYYQDVLLNDLQKITDAL